MFLLVTSDYVAVLLEGLSSDSGFTRNTEPTLEARVLASS